MGGIGKTQLALAHAQQNAQQYDSIFFLNATSEATILTSFQAIAERIFTAHDYLALHAQQVSIYIKDWLSDPHNKRWLLIFDNYDEPQSYDIRSFFPNTAHGTIIVTTRRADLVPGDEITVRPLPNDHESFRFLKLVQDVVTSVKYLDAYEERWNISTRRPLVLGEYQDRTLYTTWELSYERLKKEDSDAARLLKLFAYFDHQAIWYDLLHVGARDDHPDWLLRIINDPSEFESIMGTLVDYCFIETQRTTLSYSIHTCVHDWIMANLNSKLEPWGYWYAFYCVAKSIKSEEWESLGHIRYARLTPHALRLMLAKFTTLRHDLGVADVIAADNIVKLLQRQVQLSSAALLLENVLRVREKALGLEHVATLSTMNDLGCLYRIQGKPTKAEQMLNRAQAGWEKVLGMEHEWTLDSYNNLSVLYSDQCRLFEAEKMSILALAGYEKILGSEHISTLTAGNNLGNIYREQGKLMEAEKMLLQALAGCEEALPPRHALTLYAATSLGLLYSDQNKLSQAEQIYSRTLAGYEKTLGPEHTSTLTTVRNLGNLYRKQGKLREAEQFLERAATGMRKMLGADHPNTKNAFDYLQVLRLDMASE